MSLTRITRGVIKPNENYDTHNINSTGIITAIGANFSGNVSVGGVLTYEDVTSIDSVGLITARSGIKDSTLTAGHVVFAGTAGRLSGEAELFYNSSNNRLGIGTNNPLSLLHVDGDVTIKDASPSILFSDDSGVPQNPDYKIQVNTGNFVINDDTNSKTRLLIDSSGNIGIGTDNPTQILHILDDSPIIQFTDTNGLGSRINADSGNLYLDTHNLNRDIIFRGGNSSANEVARITGDGKVGIGTDNPSHELDIESSSPVIEMKDNDAGDSRFQIAQSGAQTFLDMDIGGLGSSSLRFRFAGTERVRFTTAGKVGIGTDNPQETLHVHEGHIVVGQDAGNSTGIRNYIKFGRADNPKAAIGFINTTGNGRGDILFINSDVSNTNEFSDTDEIVRFTREGKVGIGTDAPNAPIHVQSSDNTLGILTSTDDGANLDLSDNDTMSRIRSVDGRLHLYADFGGNVSNSAIRFFVDGNDEKVRIASDGNVGIGTVSPEQNLHVVGNVQIDGDSASTASLDIDNQVNLGNTAGNEQLLLKLRGNVANDGQLIFKNIRLSNGTNWETSAFRVQRRVDVSDFGYIDFGTGAGGAGRNIQFGNGSGTIMMHLDSSGKVGINSTAPSSYLDVRGDINFQNNALITSMDSSGVGGSNIDHIWHSDASTYGAGGSWNFVSDGTYKATGNSTLQMGFVNCSGGANFLGDVGIGLTSPATDLHVQSASSIVRVESTNSATSARVEIVGASNSYSGLHFGDTSDVDNGFIRYYNDANNRYFLIGTAAAERVKIHSDGRVNIGGANEVQLTANNEAILYLHGAIVGADVDNAFALRSIMDDDDTGTATADRERGSALFQFNGSASGGDTADECRLWNIHSDVNALADYDNIYGLYSDCRASHTSGTVTTMRGCYGLVQTADSGTVTEMVGLYGIAQPTSGSSGTVADVIGVKARANMAAGTSTVQATDLFGVWAQIDNDNDVNQANSGTRTALFYGSYDKTTGLTTPQGIRIDTDVPNYFRGGIAIDGGSSFTPTGGHSIHIRNSDNATGIFLEQTGDQYNVIRGNANRSGADNAIIDIQGYWDTTQVARMRIDTGADTTNKDDGRIQFFTASSGSLTERMRIQENGEIAMRSSGTPSDALANLHVQNETFRVSNDSDGANTTYIALTAHANSTDTDRNIYKHVKNSVIKSQITSAGHVFTHASHYVGRTRTDANSPSNVYSNGSHGFFAYSGRTDDTANYRGILSLRAWDGGDTADRNIIYFSDSGSDTTTNDYDQHQYFGVKANGMTQIGSHLFAGRVESDEGAPNSIYRGVSGTAVIVYPTSGSQYTRCDARTTDNTDQVFKVDSGGGVVIKFQSNGDGRFDGGADIGNASDYAEYFEWLDGNTSGADRRGMTVVMDGEKIRPATDSDDTSKIIGVVSAKPAVVGDSAWSEWQLAHLKDAYGSWVTKDEEYLVWNKFGTFTDTDGVKKPNPQPDINDYNMASEHQILVSDIEKEKAAGNCPQAAIDQNLRVTKPSRIYNPDYDKTRTYVPRSERNEWDAIGLMGKLVVRRGQPIGANWILMKSNVGVDPNDNSIVLDKYLVR